ALRHGRSRFCEIAQNRLLSSGLQARNSSTLRQCLTATSAFADKRAACWSKGRHHEGAPDSAKRARCPRADRHSPLPGGFGHHVRRYYGRCAGCSRWTWTGKSGERPQTTGSQETWPEVEKPRPRNHGQSRGGAPRGERARSGRFGSSVARAAPEARTGGDICSCGAAHSICAFRRSASLFYLEAKQQWLSFLLQSSGAKATARMRSLV